VAADALGPVDAVLISHDERPDNLDAAEILGAKVVIPAHVDGWAHFSEGVGEFLTAFDQAGIANRLKVAPHGDWVDL
jgi:L-ascorbate metabolism protein UlaG (beta-lactamase superfamily)